MLHEEKTILELIDDDVQIYEMMKRIRISAKTQLKEIISSYIFAQLRDIEAFFNPKRYYLVVNQNNKVAMLYSINKKGSYKTEDVTELIDFKHPTSNFSRKDDTFEYHKNIK
ncbi:hypothetical protein [Macrococcoides canis]|uniref:hypothetical protein n=1 Tax=Macrococcoides canis TaxID=1855823 RepID=UPI00165D95DF|nr:hypothetical protein [Macrococcus canis]QNR07740.1 hypothetical protein GL258_05545 [Macrococcus canis]